MVILYTAIFGVICQTVQELSQNDIFNLDLFSPWVKDLRLVNFNVLISFLCWLYGAKLL